MAIPCPELDFSYPAGEEFSLLGIRRLTRAMHQQGKTMRTEREWHFLVGVTKEHISALSNLPQNFWPAHKYANREPYEGEIGCIEQCRLFFAEPQQGQQA